MGWRNTKETFLPEYVFLLGVNYFSTIFSLHQTTCICTSLLSKYRVFKRSRNLWSDLSSTEKGALLLCSTRLRPPTRDLRVERGYFETSVFLVSITKWHSHLQSRLASLLCRRSAGKALLATVESPSIVIFQSIFVLTFLLGLTSVFGFLVS